jgi:hypothetical protein
MLVDVHHGKFRHLATEKEPGQDGLTCRGTGDDLVLLKHGFRLLEGGSDDGMSGAARKTGSRNKGGKQTSSMVPPAIH